MLSSRSVRLAIFSALMIASATATNALMDCLWSRYDRSVFAHFDGHRSWLDPRISWKNKWKEGDASQGEAFPFSSTALVASTDAWHLCKTLTISFITLALLAPFTQLFRLPWYGWLLAFCGVQLLYGVVFEGLYAHLLLRG